MDAENSGSSPEHPTGTITMSEKAMKTLEHARSTNAMITAIKAYRELTGAGLREAKYAIDEYRDFSKEGNPIDWDRLFSWFKASAELSTIKDIHFQLDEAVSSWEQDGYDSPRHAVAAFMLRWLDTNGLTPIEMPQK